MIDAMTALRERLERGYAMRAQRVVEGLFLTASFVFDDLRPAYAAFALLALEVLSPLASPVTLLWLAFERRFPPDRLGNLYHDAAGARGAAAISCLVLTTAFALIHWTALPTLGRDLLVRAGVLRGTPEGACDVEIDGH